MIDTTQLTQLIVSAILSQLNLVEDIGIGVEGVEYKLLNVRLFDKATMRKVYEQQTTNAKKKACRTAHIAP
jgi:hypothetical protein